MFSEVISQKELYSLSIYYRRQDPIAKEMFQEETRLHKLLPKNILNKYKKLKRLENVQLRNVERS
jgi:hypothetical protein